MESQQLTEIDERPIFIINSHGNGDTVRGGVVTCTLWSYPSILHAPTVINISNQSPCCLSICEQFFHLERNAELGLNEVVRNVGGEATENETPSRRTGAAEPRHTEANAAHSVPPGLETRSGDSRAAGGNLPHFADEARRTVDAGEQRSHGALCGKIEGGTETSGRAACLWMGGHDDFHDHGSSTISEDKQKVVTYTSSANSPETLLQSIYWSQFKKTFQKDWIKWQCSVDSQTQPILCLIIKAMKSRGAKEKFGQAPAGGNVRERSTYARRSVMQAGWKGGQQLLTSWIRPKMPSIVQ